MNPLFLKNYETELLHIKESAADFAHRYPKIAGRLGLDEQGSVDPHVERLLEGFSYLSARVQTRMDAGYPEFTHQLLEQLYPHYLAPTPAMTIVQFEPDLQEGQLSSGYTLDRHTSLRSLLGPFNQSACEFLTATQVTLWPLHLTQAQYGPLVGDFSRFLDSQSKKPKAMLRISLKTTTGHAFSELTLDQLVIYLQGVSTVPVHLLEQLMVHTVCVLVDSNKNTNDSMDDNIASLHKLAPRPWEQLGFSDDEALLPQTAQTFQAHRYLQEYFSFTERYNFVRLKGLAPALKKCSGNELQIIVLLDDYLPDLQFLIDHDNFSLFCTPCINLFPKRTDRIHLSDTQFEFPVIVDRSKPLDYEVYSVVDAWGFGQSSLPEQTFKPFFSASSRLGVTQKQGYFQTRREVHVTSKVLKGSSKKPLNTYPSTDVYISLTDAESGEYRSNLQQLGMNVLCTNRDLPLTMPLGAGPTDFTVDLQGPVQSIRCVRAPTQPRAALSLKQTGWRLINLLKINSLSFIDDSVNRHLNQEGSCSQLKELMTVFCPEDSPNLMLQIEGLKSMRVESVVRRLPVRGRACYGRGLQVHISLDPQAFEGHSMYLFGCLIERVLAKAVDLNSFTELVIYTRPGLEPLRWAPRRGLCELL